MTARRAVALHQARKARGEKGWTIIFVALLLVPMIAFAGMAVDAGSWYARAAQIQRAADAAALAGVPLLGLSDAQAIAEAQRVATLNGFTNGVNGVSVNVSRVTGLQRLRVSITDTRVTQYLTRMFRSNVSITRTATAEQVRPVPLGSARNYLGTQNLLATSAEREGFWGAFSGNCASREQGDRIGPRSDYNWSSSSFAGCQPGNPGHVVANAEYNGNGYLYAVEVPPTFTGRLRVQIFDAPACMTGNGPDTTNNSSDNGAFPVTLRMRGRNDLDPLASPIIQTWNLAGADSETGVCTRPAGATIATGSNGVECGSSASSEWHQCWKTIWDVTNPTPGTYYIQVIADADAAAGAEADSSNEFALRAWQGGSGFATCTTDPTSAAPAYSAAAAGQCPNVHGLTHLGVYANIGGASATFYLADVGPEHNGKTMEITLWDTGEGASTIEILNPLLNPVSFRWDVLCQNGSGSPCTGENAPTGGYGGTTTSSLSVAGSGTQPSSNNLSSSLYNDRLVRLTVQLPTDITAAYGAANWWRIRYTTASSPTDRTTWSVAIQGDPVRLVPNS